VLERAVTGGLVLEHAGTSEIWKPFAGVTQSVPAANTLDATKDALAWDAGGGAVTVENLATGARRDYRVSERSVAVQAAGFSPGAATLAVMIPVDNTTNALVLVDLATGRVDPVPSSGVPPSGAVAWTADGGAIVLSGYRPLPQDAVEMKVFHRGSGGATPLVVADAGSTWMVPG
jgi:hypothetical protein